jgi:mannose-6-phosphate isomerase-like protein (cupin superfamily)
MVALPFLITTATVIYAVLYPPEQEGRIESSKVLSPSSRIDSFWVGIGVGISLSWLTSYEIKRRRLWQRVRLKFLSWLYDSDFIMIGGEKRGGKPPLLQKFRKPCQISQLNGTRSLRKSESEDNNSDGVHGTHLELVSPDWALSSHLYCDVVTLPPGTELVSKNAEGVEFYYVMKGDGIYVDQNGEKHEISAEDGFIVDPEWYVLTFFHHETS